MDQEQVLQHAIEVLERQQIPYMLVGSIAGMAYSKPRMTLDIDIVLDLALTLVETFASEFPFERGYYCYAPAIEKAVRTRSPFNVIHLTSGQKLDFMPVRDDAFGRSELGRRRRIMLMPELQGYAASPEDIVLGKLWYYSIGESEKHLEDIASIWRITTLDMSYIEHWIQQLGLEVAWSKLQAYAQRPKLD